MPQNSVDHAWIGNKGNDAHAPAAPAQQRVRLEYFPDQASPRAAGFAGAEIPCPATERQKMLLVTFGAAYSGETSFKPSTGQEVVDRTHHHGAQRPRTRLEALFAGADIAVKVSLK